MNKHEVTIITFYLAVIGLCALMMGETEIASGVVCGLCGILVPKKE